MTKVAFIGLGVMGYPMAGHLQTKGHEVTVYNRTTAKAETWVAEYGGGLAATPRAARRMRGVREGSARGSAVTDSADRLALLSKRSSQWLLDPAGTSTARLRSSTYACGEA